MKKLAASLAIAGFFSACATAVSVDEGALQDDGGVPRTSREGGLTPAADASRPQEDAAVPSTCKAGTVCTPTNACKTGLTVCNGATSRCDEQANVDDGTSCGAGRTCTSGVCNATPAVTGECLIIAEYIESSSVKVVEVYNCGTTSLDLSKYGLCLVSNDNTTCTTTKLLTGTLAKGGMYVVCASSASTGVTCDLSSTVANFNGDDRIGLFYDSNGDQLIDMSDTLVDSFGNLTTAPSSKLWDEVDYRRTKCTPFMGTSSFQADVYYKDYPVGISNLRVAPACP